MHHFSVSKCFFVVTSMGIFHLLHHYNKASVKTTRRRLFFLLFLPAAVLANEYPLDLAALSLSVVSILTHG